MEIKNPVLSGFYPDPSVVRVGNMYYLATSTFEWFPGVCLFESSNLKDWKPIGHALTRKTQLDMKGCDHSAGVFAPCLSYDNGVFYLVYTNVRTHHYEYMDCHNYLVTTTDIHGEWSEPIYLHSVGFDPSLFHDDDGKKWLVSVHRRYKSDRCGGVMNGIALQEYDPVKKQMRGDMQVIYYGSGKITTPEGPHLYKKDGYYYLLTAEGGTGYGHAATIARAKEICGPYEAYYGNPILTSAYDSSLTLQKAGHGCFVETPEQEWYMMHLCARPIKPWRKCPLGRETAIQKIEWHEGWPVLADGGKFPAEMVQVPDTQKDCQNISEETSRAIFGENGFLPDAQSLRIPLDNTMVSFDARPGYMRLYGKDSPNSRFEQSLVARRQQHFCFMAETCVEFTPDSERQMAGLIYMYDADNFYYFHITCDYYGKKILAITTMNHASASHRVVLSLPEMHSSEIYLRLQVENEIGSFWYSLDGKEWTDSGFCIDVLLLTDENCELGAYTGAMIGVCCNDMQNRCAAADFAYFKYSPKK